MRIKNGSSYDQNARSETVFLLLKISKNNVVKLICFSRNKNTSKKSFKKMINVISLLIKRMCIRPLVSHTTLNKSCFNFMTLRTTGFAAGFRIGYFNRVTTITLKKKERLISYGVQYARKQQGKYW